MTVRSTVTRPAWYGFPYYAGLDKSGETRYTNSMKVDRVMKKKTVSNLCSGEVVKAGYKRANREFMDTNRFVGFKVGSLHFNNLRDLKNYFGIPNLRALEFEIDRQEFGSLTAEFQCVSEQDPYFWGAYLYNGAFRVGTSADKLSLEVA